MHSNHTCLNVLLVQILSTYRQEQANFKAVIVLALVSCKWWLLKLYRCATVQLETLTRLVTPYLPKEDLVVKNPALIFQDPGQLLLHTCIAHALGAKLVKTWVRILLGVGLFFFFALFSFLASLVESLKSSPSSRYIATKQYFQLGCWGDNLICTEWNLNNFFRKPAFKARF